MVNNGNDGWQPRAAAVAPRELIPLTGEERALIEGQHILAAFNLLSARLGDEEEAVEVIMHHTRPKVNHRIVFWGHVMWIGLLILAVEITVACQWGIMCQ